jgi:AraC-like DNA-binding protein
VGRAVKAQRHRASGLLVGWVPCHIDPWSRLYPEVILVPHRDPSGRNRSIWRLLRLAEEEAAGNAPGRDSVLRRLSEIVVVELLRAVMAQEKDANPAWIRGLADERLARLVAAIQQKPGSRWTLGEMGRVAGLSRSALESTFARVLGQTPRRYLTRVRIRRAALELVEGRRSTAEVASSLGYESEAAFHRAFKRVTGMTVGQLRRLSKNGTAEPALASVLLRSAGAAEPVGTQGGASR